MMLPMAYSSDIEVVANDLLVAPALFEETRDMAMTQETL
jgi:hypothetical protein